MSQAKIEALLFDLDNTLADREGAFKRLCREFWQAEPTINSSVVFNDAYLKLCEWDADGRTFPKRDIFDLARQEWGELIRTPDEMERWYESVYPSMFRPDVRVTRFLQRVEQVGIPWGIVSNGPAFQSQVIRQIGLQRAAPRSVISAEFGSAKPAQVIFEEGLRRIGFESAPGRCLFVGDSPIADVEGARSAGMQTGWIIRGRSWPADLTRPDYTLGHVSDLAEVLGI